MNSLFNKVTIFYCDKNFSYSYLSTWPDSNSYLSNSWVEHVTFLTNDPLNGLVPCLCRFKENLEKILVSYLPECTELASHTDSQDKPRRILNERLLSWSNGSFLWNFSIRAAILMHSLTFIAGLLLQYSSLASREHTHIWQLGSSVCHLMCDLRYSLESFSKDPSLPSTASGFSPIFMTVRPGIHFKPKSASWSAFGKTRL